MPATKLARAARRYVEDGGDWVLVVGVSDLLEDAMIGDVLFRAFGALLVKGFENESLILYL
jgi:hypothetical protein